jgi:hypothetical protein
MHREILTAYPRCSNRFVTCQSLPSACPPDVRYFADFFRFLCLKPAAWPFRFEALVRVRWRLLDAGFLLLPALPPAGRRRDLRGDGFTFAATAPSVEPIERATVTRKS